MRPTIHLPLLLLALLFFTVGLRPVAWAHGALDEKIATLRAAILREPANAALRFDLAAAHQEHGDWQIALALLDRVEELAPEKHPTLLVRGQALADGGRYSEARAALDEFIQSHQQNATARLARARVLSALGESARAADDAAAAVAASPEPTTEILLALADYHRAAGRSEVALATLDGARKKFGPLPVLVERAVTIELALGRPARALARLDEQLAALPPAQQPPWLADKARLQTRLGQTTETRRTWQALLDYTATLPPLDRATPALAPLVAEARTALAPAPSSPTVSLAPPVPPPAP